MAVVNSIVQCVKEVVQHRHLLRRLLTGSRSGIQCALSLNHAAHSVQQLCKEVLDLFDNGLLFFLGQVSIFRQPLGELLAALLRACLTANKVKDHLADGIFFALEPLYSLAAAAVNAQRKRIPLVYQIADNK